MFSQGRKEFKVLIQSQTNLVLKEVWIKQLIIKMSWNTVITFDWSTKTYQSSFNKQKKTCRFNFKNVLKITVANQPIIILHYHKISNQFNWPIERQKIYKRHPIRSIGLASRLRSWNEKKIHLTQNIQYASWCLCLISYPKYLKRWVTRMLQGEIRVFCTTGQILTTLIHILRFTSCIIILQKRRLKK